MKKISLLSLFITIAGAMVYAQSVTVTSPNGGESWTVGSSHNITWTSSGVSENVKIKLYKGGVSFGPITSNTADDGSYNWPIPASLNGHTLTTGSDYVMRIETLSENAADESDRNFTIAKAGSGSIKVTSPTSIWSFNAGGKMTVKWRTSGITGNVKIALHKKGGSQVMLVHVAQPHNRSPRRFTIPKWLPTGKYHIIVSQGYIFGKSENFSINTKPGTISISHPYENASCLKGKVCTIKWHSHKIPDNFVNIWLHHVSSDSLKPLFPIAWRVANKKGRNSYSWKISKSFKEGDYQVYVEDTSKKYSGKSKKFKILDSRKCDLALVDVKYCGKNIVATIKNMGDHYVGKILLKLQMPYLKPTPFFKTFPAKEIALFRNKSTTITYKKPYYSQIKYRANFMLSLITDKEHTDQNQKNNQFVGRVYGGCKPDLSIINVSSGKKGPSKVGDKLKLICQIQNMGGEVKTPWVLRLEIKTYDGVVVHVKEWTFRIFDMVTKHEYKYKIPKNFPLTRYNFAIWCVDFYNRIDEENEGNQCRSLGFRVK